MTYLIDHLRIPGGVPKAWVLLTGPVGGPVCGLASAGLGELVAQVGVAEVTEPVGLSDRDAAVPGERRDRVAGRVQPHDPGRQLGQHTPADGVDDVALGHETKMRWNDSGDWVWSGEVVHEPLVSVEDFERAQAMFSIKKRETRRTPKEGRQYVLAGLVRCSLCKRRMQGQWTHGRAYYRCRYPLDYAVDEHEHPRSIYVRADRQSWPASKRRLGM